jgi:hypothetical protein
VNDRIEIVAGHPDLRGRWISSILSIDENEVWLTTLGAGIFLLKRKFPPSQPPQSR